MQQGDFSQHNWQHSTVRAQRTIIIYCTLSVCARLFAWQIVSLAPGEKNYEAHLHRWQFACHVKSAPAPWEKTFLSDFTSGEATNELRPSCSLSITRLICIRRARPGRAPFCFPPISISIISFHWPLKWRPVVQQWFCCCCAYANALECWLRRSMGKSNWPIVGSRARLILFAFNMVLQKITAAINILICSCLAASKNIILCQLKGCAIIN